MVEIKEANFSSRAKFWNGKKFVTRFWMVVYYAHGFYALHVGAPPWAILLFAVAPMGIAFGVKLGVGLALKNNFIDGDDSP